MKIIFIALRDSYTINQFHFIYAYEFENCLLGCLGTPMQPNNLFLRPFQ